LTLRSAESRAYTLSYEDVGDGPAIVLVNGMASPAAEWRERCYVDRLVERHRVLSVDSLGHGRSETPHDWGAYRAPEVGTDILAVMDAAGVERAALWGYSRGGWLVAMAAAEVPERVATLIAGGWAASEPPQADEEVPPRTQALLRGDWAAFWAALPVAVADEDKRYMEESSDPKAIGAADLGARRSRYVIDLDRIAAPTLLYYGAQDAAEPEFASAISATAEGLGIEPRVLSGDHDHFSAFEDADSVVPLVSAHLQGIGVY
jgi:pimeloyl-ACP methyl ester carboxylesterase